MNILFKLCFCLVCFFNYSFAYSAEYYVAPNGNSTWNACVNIATPCSPQTAMANAVAGDIVYFRGGTYELAQPSDSTFYWTNGVLNPSHSGTADLPIVFMAYPGEKPIMNVGSLSSRYSGIAFGLNDHEYIIYDGFKLIADGGVKAGGIKLQSTNSSTRLRGNVVRNCEFDGGSTIISSNDNWEGLRIEDTVGTLVENCIFYNFRHVTNWHNTSAIKMYHNNDVTIRNCEVYQSSTGIYFKSDTDNSWCYNNYIHNCDQGIFVATYLAMSSDSLSFYNNVIADCGYACFVVDSEEESTANDLKIYNNTFYGCADMGVKTGQNVFGHGAEIYNNIFPAMGTGSSLVTGYTRTTVAGNLKAVDHNQWITKFKIITKAKGYHTYTDLSSWQGSSELEDGGAPGFGSLASDPMFENISGKMNQLNDFRLVRNSQCIGSGRGGVDMGADIDLVGVNRDGQISPPPSPPPAAVQDFMSIK